VVWHIFDADPGPKFHVDADPDPYSDPDWYQNDADPHADPTPSFNIRFFYAFSRSFASLQSFIFLISVKDVIIRSILDIILKFCRASIVYHLFHIPGIDTDPDRHADPYKDPDSAK
jgi:hypothetical protein